MERYGIRVGTGHHTELQAGLLDGANDGGPFDDLAALGGDGQRQLLVAHLYAAGVQAHGRLPLPVRVIVDYRPEHRFVADDHKAWRDWTNHHVQGADDIGVSLAHDRLLRDPLSSETPGRQRIGEIDGNPSVA